jgi:hypothetical protein
MRHLSTRHAILLSIATALTLAIGACASDTASSTTAPTPVTTAETFSGTVEQLGTTGVPFIVSTDGPLTIGLTSVAPLSTMALGVGIGTWNGSTCGASITKNDNARSGITALTGTATAGNYCVIVYDSGNIPEGWSVSFAVQVVHP